MRVVVKKWGNSAAVRIPAGVMKTAGLTVDQTVDVRVVNGRIIIEPVVAQTYNLEDLLAGITEANRHDPIEFGPAVGQEVG